jgi:hypothetical protein
MEKPRQYTAIPPTSDLNYWLFKPGQRGGRTTIFVPRDPDLHRRLKAAAWEVIQANLPYKLRARPSYKGTGQYKPAEGAAEN